tara:strand:+ start:3792 stop:4016 length:225 start_codon:yes stop_codon:yes gene_type:complete
MREPYFFTENTNPSFKSKGLKGALGTSTSDSPSHYSNTLTLDDFTTSTQLINTDQTQFTLLSNALFNLDDSYDT